MGNRTIRAGGGRKASKGNRDKGRVISSSIGRYTGGSSFASSAAASVSRPMLCRKSTYSRLVAWVSGFDVPICCSWMRRVR